MFALSEHGATSAAAKWLAQKENAADLIGGVNLEARDPVLARTLIDLSQTAQISDSLKVGRHVLDGIGTVNPLHRGAVEQAGFAVLKAPDIPSILVETAFISNPDEELKLRSERYQAQFAQSIHEGIRRYFASNPPLARSREAATRSASARRGPPRAAADSDTMPEPIAASASDIEDQLHSGRLRVVADEAVEERADDRGRAAPPRCPTPESARLGSTSAWIRKRAACEAMPAARKSTGCPSR